MKPLEQALASLIGKEPTPETIKKLYKMKEELQFSEHDSIWSILLAFGHYEVLYGEYIEQIGTTTKASYAEFKLGLENEAAAIAKRMQVLLLEQSSEVNRELIKKLTEASKPLIEAESRRKFIIGALVGGVVAVVAIALVAWGSYAIGRHATDADGAWLQTREGKAARKFAEMNSISTMLECPSEFVQKQEGDGVYCIPFETANKKNRGWRIK